MKNYIVTVWILLIVAASLLTSCEKDPWKFDTDRKPGLYFVELADTNEIAFDQLNDSLWTRKLFICYLIGAPTDYDRQIEFAPIDSGSNMKFGEDYKFSDATMKAGEVYCNVYLWAKRPAVEDEDGKRYCTFRIVENEHFVPYMYSTAFFKVLVYHPREPQWWDKSIFGSWSEKSYQVYMRFYNKQEEQNTDNWQKYYKTVYGTNMYIMNGVSKWEGVPLMFLPLLKEDVLVPMFDYFVANPYEGVEIPEWYYESKK